MFGLLDLFVFLGLLGFSACLTLIGLIDYLKRKNKKVVKIVQVKRLEKLPPEKVMKFNCLKCGAYTILERKAATRFPEAMTRFKVIRMEKTGLCDKCFVKFIDYEKFSLDNSVTKPVGILRLIVLENFLKDEKIYVENILEIFTEFDKDLKKGFEIFNHDDFYGTYIDMLNSAKLLLGLTDSEEVNN